MAIDNKDKKVLKSSIEREQNEVACSAECEKIKGSKNLNVPHLRFPEFSGEWKRVELKDVAEFQKSRIPADSLDASCYISTENLIPNFGGIKEASSIPTDGNVMAIKPNDILISNIRPYLKKVWQSDRFGGCSADVFVLRTTRCQSDFLYNIIASDKFINYAMSGAKGVKMPRGDKRQMEEFEFSIPAIEEQNRISRLLSLLDERIATQNKIIEKLQSLIKGIAQHCIKESTSGNTYVKLGDICQITTGKLDANAQVDNGIYPFFTCAEQPFKIDSFAFDTEALLISGNGANLGYINYYKGKFNAYQRTYVLDLFSENIQYIKWALKVLLPKRIAIEKSSSNTPYIVLSTLTDLRLPIPCKSKQSFIANLMQSLERKLSNQIAQYDSYNYLKQYLLRQMFI